MSDMGFIFIPGGVMSAWVWRDIDERIRGRSVFIQGRLARNSLPERRRATLKDCVDHIEEQAASSPSSALIIVAHSGGGVLAPLAARRMKNKVKGIIFVSAGIPAHGRSILHEMPLPIRLLNILAMQSQLKRDTTPARSMEKAIRSAFCNTSTEEVIQYVLGQDLLTEPLCCFREKVDWQGVPEIPMTFIRLLRDRTATLEFQNRMAANLRIHDFHDIESDHMVMLSHPAELSKAIREIADRMVGVGSAAAAGVS